MGKVLKNRRFFNILLLICLTGFLVLPEICLADDFDDITLRETAKHLELPENKVQDLIRSLINIFHSNWTDLVGSGYVSAEEMAVPSIMKKAVQVQALNHLLIDAPIEITGKIIKNTVKIVRLFLGQNFGSIFEEIEKESVKRAIGYGMSILVENETRMSPGAIGFKYELREGGIKEVIIQYIVIYNPSDVKSGEMIIKFYSVESLKPPKNEGSIGGRLGTYTELEHDLPPFIVDIRGNTEDYKWIGKPTVKIDFPPEVPDLGIRPLNFWERQILKPIETTIKEVEIIITKVTGKSPGLTDIWEEVKKFISKIKSFAPAALVESPETGEEQLAIDETALLTVQENQGIISGISMSESGEGEIQPVEIAEEPKGGPVVTLEAIQEVLDDVSERVDVLDQEITEFIEAKLPQVESQQPELSEAEIETEEKLEGEETEEQIEEIEEIEEKQEKEEQSEEPEQKEKEDIILCKKTNEAVRNKVIFNEIAWMGTENSANDEWIELKNISGIEINLSGWQISDKDNQIKIIFGVSKNLTIVRFFDRGLLLLERSDDNSVPGIAADLIYSGAINNDTETLYLFDENCQLQDEVLANPDWPAGDSSSKRTMERKNDLNWQTSADTGGTPKRENSSGYIPYFGGVVVLPQTPPVEETVANPPAQILITEIQIGTSTSTDEDFIELYNFSVASLNISDFQLKKRNLNGNESSIRVFPENSVIQARDYFIWLNSDYASSSQIMADATSSQTLAQNNSIVLLDINDNIIDALAWGTSTNPYVETLAFSENPGENQTLGRKWSTTAENYIDTDNNQNDFEIQSPTLKTQNQSPEISPPTNQLPVAVFSFIPATSTINQEIIFDASSSTDADGTITNYIWDLGDNTISTTTEATITHNYSTSSDFLVSLTVVDNNNATNSAMTTIAITTPDISSLEVVINEIQIDSIIGAGGADDDWIELYNSTTQDVSLAGWSIQEHSATTSCSIDVGFYKKSFPGTAVIPAQGFFLIIDTQANENLKMIADMEIGWLLTEGNTIYLVNNEDPIESGEYSDIVDKVGFGENACFPEGSPAANPPEENSIERKELGLDTDDNSQDFVINGNPSPTNSKGESGPTFLTNYQVTEDVTFSIQGSPYIIQGSLTINEGKTLTVGPGVSLKFNSNTGLKIHGTIIAIGEENNKIIFTSYSDVRWKYIHFSASSTDSVLENCLIKNLSYDENNWAISVVSTSIILKNSRIENTATNVLQLRDSSSTVENLTIEKNSTGAAMEILGGAPEIKNSKFIDTYAGMFIGEGSRATIEGNYFELKAVSPLEPVFVDNSYPVLKNNQGTSTNALNGISLFGTITQNWQLGKNEDFPYYISYLENTASTTLEINPGVVVKFKEGGKLEIRGTLRAEGTDNEKILFTSLQGYSGEISFVSESASSSLKNVILEYGNSSGVVKVSNTNVDFQNTEFRKNDIALLLENSSSTVSNCVFSDNPAISVKINGGNPVIKNSNFSNGNVAIVFENDSQGLVENNSFEGFHYSQGVITVRNSSPLFRENSGQNNTINGIYLYGTVSNDWTLYKNEIPYVVSNLVIISGKSLEVNPGVVAGFYNSNSKLEVEGALKAIGQEGNEITFKAFESWWDTIHFISQEATSTLKYVTISNGGKSSTAFKGALSVEGAKVEFSNLTFDGNYFSLYFKNASSSTIASSSFTNCQRGILIEGDCPRMTNLNLNCTCNFASPAISCSTSTESICP